MKMTTDGMGGGRRAAQRGECGPLLVRKFNATSAKKGIGRDRGGTVKASPKGRIWTPKHVEERRGACRVWYGADLMAKFAQKAAY
ncbi:hypothetical protein AN958_00518 [Leucoagaricus sp. SymC.cos]|nr:hypothetical protein AN958_00518 [Leucoagaricus sp. SymC.cos]